jgi:hypothetical protein
MWTGFDRLLLVVIAFGVAGPFIDQALAALGIIFLVLAALALIVVPVLFVLGYLAAWQTKWATRQAERRVERARQDLGY